jgi:hypothetical protein
LAPPRRAAPARAHVGAVGTLPSVALIVSAPTRLQGLPVAAVVGHVYERFTVRYPVRNPVGAC